MPVLDQLQAGIAAAEQGELDVARQRPPLRLGQPQVQLEADRARRRRAAASRAGRACRWRGAPRPRAAVAAIGGDPHAGAVAPRARAPRSPRRTATPAPPPPRPAAARRAGGATGPRRGTAAPPRASICAGDEPHRARSARAPSRPSRSVELRQLGRRLAAQELAADLVVRPALALEQDDPTAGRGEAAGGGGTGEPAADDRDVPAHAVRRRCESASPRRSGPARRPARSRCRGGPPRASIRSSTNITVAELMLP